MGDLVICDSPLLLRWECSAVDGSCFVHVLERLWRGPLMCVRTGRVRMRG